MFALPGSSRSPPGRGVWGEEDGDARTRREDRKEGTLVEEVREKRTAARGRRDYCEEGRRWEDCVHIHVNGPAQCCDVMMSQVGER